MNNSYSLLISDIFRLETHRATKEEGTVGVEIEAEGNHLPDLMATAAKFWKAMPEGSLRNGIEYVLRSPMSLEGLQKALHEWDEIVVKSNSEFYDSIRTSTHVHVNVRQYTVRQTLIAIMACWLVESVLVETQGPTRVGNLFCLRTEDAENLAKTLIHEIETDQLFSTSTNNNNRYAAVNLASLAKFGSLEFRFFKGMYTGEEIYAATKSCHDLVTKAVKIDSITDLLRYHREMRGSEFLGMFFDMPTVAKILLANKGHVQDRLKVNVHLVEDVLRALNKKKFKKPVILFGEDIRPDPITSAESQVLKMRKSPYLEALTGTNPVPVPGPVPQQFIWTGTMQPTTTPIPPELADAFIDPPLFLDEINLETEEA